MKQCSIIQEWKNRISYWNISTFFQVFKTILVVLLSIIGIQAQFSRSDSEEFDSDGFWSENFRSLDNVNFDNFEFMPEFDFDSFFRKIDAPPIKEAQERRKNPKKNYFI